MSTHSLCFDQKYEKYQNFLSENFHFLVGKFSVYLNRRVFVMTSAVGVLSYTVKAFATPDRFSANSTKVEFHLQKTEKFQIKNSDIFHISAQNIDCGYSLEPPRRGGSNGYPKSMFYAVIRKIIYTPVNPVFCLLYCTSYPFEMGSTR